jgi:hypothetical protein
MCIFHTVLSLSHTLAFIFSGERLAENPGHPLPLMGGGSSRDAHVPAPLMASGRRVIYSPPVPAVCVRCPLCSRVLRPPTGHAVFRCPCGSVLSNGAVGPPRSAPAPSPAEQLILRSIQGLPASHPQRLFLLHLLAALPRNEAGAVDVRWGGCWGAIFTGFSAIRCRSCATFP